VSSIGVHFSSRESLFYIYLAASTTSFNVDSTSLAIMDTIIIFDNSVHDLEFLLDRNFFLEHDFVESSHWLRIGMFKTISPISF